MQLVKYILQAVSASCVEERVSLCKERAQILLLDHHHHHHQSPPKLGNKTCLSKTPLTYSLLSLKDLYLAMEVSELIPLLIMWSLFTTLVALSIAQSLHSHLNSFERVWTQTSTLYNANCALPLSTSFALCLLRVSGCAWSARALSVVLFLVAARTSTEYSHRVSVLNGILLCFASVLSSFGSKSGKFVKDASWAIDLDLLTLAFVDYKFLQRAPLDSG